MSLAENALVSWLIEEEETTGRDIYTALRRVTSACVISYTEYFAIQVYTVVLSSHHCDTL